MLFGERSTEASVTNASLVATFHKANPPLVWKFDLERNHSFTLALQGEEGDWELGLTSPKGDFYPVTHFLTREDAEEAFKEVNRALTRRKFSPLWFAVKFVVGLVLLAIIVFLFRFLPLLLSDAHRMPAGYHPPLSMEGMPQGMPMPADAFLRRPGLGSGSMPALGQSPAPPPAAPVPPPPGVAVPADEILTPPH